MGTGVLFLPARDPYSPLCMQVNTHWRAHGEDWLDIFPCNMYSDPELLSAAVSVSLSGSYVCLIVCVCECGGGGGSKREVGLCWPTYTHKLIKLYSSASTETAPCRNAYVCQFATE